MDETDNQINIVLLIICLRNINFISKWFIKNWYFCEMGKVSDNGGVYMTTITSDMIILKKQVNCYLQYQLNL